MEIDLSFVSIPFALLFSVLIVLLLIIKNHTSRKILVLIACFAFYSFWDWRVLLILIGYILINFSVSKAFEKHTEKPWRRKLLIASVILNLGFLGYFKYYDFFVTSLNSLLSTFSPGLHLLGFMAPIGISFFCFSTLSYFFDIYYDIIPPSRSLLDFSLFIAFFPKIISGPIQRAKDFFSQLELSFQINLPNLNEGIQLILRGMLKKLVIADHLSIMVDNVFASPNVFSSWSTWVAVLSYSLQIFFDFSGYTDMAIGIGKVLGFDLPQNFNLPYTAQSVTEFWRRWHITLSSWFRDYLFIPLEISRARKLRGKIFQSINILIVFGLTGLWHGANWTFVVWGILHGLYISIENLISRSLTKPSPWTSMIAWIRSLFVFLVLSLTWIPFRASNWQTVGLIFKKLLFFGSTTNIEWYYIWAAVIIPLALLGGYFIRRSNWRWPIFSIQKFYTPAVILFEALIVFFFSPDNASPFIYLQF